MLVRQHLRILKNHFTFHASWFYFMLYSDPLFLSKSLPQTKQNSLINIWTKIIFGNIMGRIIIRVSPRGTLTMIQSRVVKLNVKTFQIIQICFHAKNRYGSQFSISKPAGTSPGRKSRFVKLILVTDFLILSPTSKTAKKNYFYRQRWNNYDLNC